MGPGGFPRWLREHMASADLNSVEVAEAVGVSQPAVHAWLHGQSVPRAGNIAKLARLFEVPSSQIYIALGRFSPDYEQDLTPEMRELLRLLSERPRAVQRHAVIMLQRLLDYLEETAISEGEGVAEGQE